MDKVFDVKNLEVSILKAKESLLGVLSCEEQFVTPFLQSKPGIGKSSIVRQVATELNLDHVIDVRFSQHDSVDIKGIPFKVDTTNGSYLEWLSPNFLPLEGNTNFEGTTGILFLDELNRADSRVLQSVFELVLDRKVGGKALLPGWKLVSAGNYGYEDGCDVTDFDKALSDRFLYIYIKESVSDLLTFASGKKWDKAILSWFELSPGKVFSYDQEGYIISPRTWEKVNHILTKIPSESVRRDLIKSSLYHLYPSFLAHLETVLDVKPKDIMENYPKVKKIVGEQEKATIHQLNVELVAYISDNPCYTDKHLGNFFQYYKDKLNDDNIMYILSSLRQDSNVNENTDTFIDKFFEFIKQFEGEYDKFVSILKSVLSGNLR